MKKYLLFIFYLLICVSLFSQTITGTVKDKQTNTTLPGATIQIKGSQIGVVSDLDGKFSIEASVGDVLVANFTGYSTVEITVGTVSDINIMMESMVSMLDQVVVIGYGSQKKKELTGSVASLKADDLNQGSFTTAAGLLQGKVAGLSVVNPDGGDPNAKYQILLRGSNTLTIGQGPLIIIDGVAGDDISNINFQEVENIDVLKDGSAAAIYGSRGTNGVIIITTKRAKSGQTSVEYDGQITVQSVSRRAKPLTAEQFVNAVNTYRPDAVGNLYGANTDWFDEVTRIPISHKHSLAISGGTNAFSHRTVLNVEQNQGILQKNNVNKYLFKTNIHQSILKGWLDFDYNASYIKRTYSSSSGDIFAQAF